MFSVNVEKHVKDSSKSQGDTITSEGADSLKFDGLRLGCLGSLDPTLEDCQENAVGTKSWVQADAFHHPGSFGSHSCTPLTFVIANS